MANLVIWNEFIHEQEDEVVKSIYPRGIHECIKDFLEPDEGLNISTATLAENDHGLYEELLEKTDVLIKKFKRTLTTDFRLVKFAKPRANAVSDRV